MVELCLVSLTLRITTNISGLERVAADGVTIRAYLSEQWPNSIGRNLRILKAALQSDHLVLHFSLYEVMFFAVMLKITPFQQCRLTTLDFFIGDSRPLLLPLISLCLRRVDRFLVYFKDSSVFEKLFGIPKFKFHYVPFKVNGIEMIQRTPVTDDGYIFSGGRSRRDFATFFAVVEDLGYPVKLVTSSEVKMNPHGSSLARLRIPSNVEISTEDENQEFFIRSMAAARLVVIPIKKDITTQAGIGVYLQAMALQKCVIISTSLGVSDVLSEDQAVIVPAGDRAALRRAIEGLWNDEPLRRRYAEAAYRYALPLGGEDALRRSILGALP